METSNKTSNCISTWNVALSSLFFIIFPFGLVINITAAWICLQVKSTSNFMVYLKHLVISDILICLTFPIKALNFLNVPLSLTMFDCRYNSVFFYLGMNISVIMMGLISLDRFFKIVKPGGKLLCQNLLFGKIICAVTWILLITLTTIPVIITTDQNPEENYRNICMAMKSDSGLSWHFGVVTLTEIIFWTVFIIVAFCYSLIAKKVFESYKKSRSSNNQSTRKTNFRIFLILLVFLICYVPYQSVREPYTALQVNKTNSSSRTLLEKVKDLTLCLLSTNVCLDPLIYFFLCRAFRKKFLESCFKLKWLCSCFVKTEMQATPYSLQHNPEVLYTVSANTMN